MKDETPHSLPFHPSSFILSATEGEGIEPPRLYATPIFETGALPLG